MNLHRTPLPSLLPVSILCLGWLSAACGTTTEKQLEKIAKDWNKVIRASQVIPVYPLTEDLQPGDLFLVQTTIDKQQETWDGDDYLPLDNHLARLDPDYVAFYDHSFLDPATSPPSVLPRNWMTTPTAAPEPPIPWHLAPSAAFPSYSFKVEKGGGINVAVPVSGIPVGLGLLGASSAHCTVELSDARTIGIDTISLHDDVLRWGEQEALFLSSFETPADEKETSNYVRVVSRVYLLGGIDVSIRNARSSSGGLDVAVPKPVELLTLSDDITTRSATTEDYKNNVKALNDMLKTAGDALPGGSLKITSASSRSVSMRETFPRPLVIGYLGFDYPILAGGRLGRPIPTHAAFTSTVPKDTAAPTITPRVVERMGLDIVGQLRELEGDDEAEVLVAWFDALSKLTTDSLDGFTSKRSGVERMQVTGSAAEADSEPSKYEDFRAFRGEVAASRRVLTQLQEGNLELDGATPDELEEARAEHDRVLKSLEAAEAQIMSSAVLLLRKRGVL